MELALLQTWNLSSSQIRQVVLLEISNTNLFHMGLPHSSVTIGDKHQNFQAQPPCLLACIEDQTDLQ